MALAKALGWSAAQSAVRMAVGFATIKVTAVYLGPAGLAVVGQLNNFLSMSTAATVNGVQTGLTKMTAERAAEAAPPAEVWATGLRLAMAIAALCALGMAAGSYWLARTLLLDGRYWPAFVLAGAAVVGGALNGVFNGVLNGRRRMHALALGLILSSLATLALSVPLVYFGGVAGGLAGCALGFMLTALFSGGFVRREVGRLGAVFGGRFDWPTARHLLQFYPMTLSNVVSSQLSLICVRYTLASQLGLAAAGVWQASQRLSDMYTAIIVQALSLFLMPHLAGIRDGRRFRRELFGVSLKAGAMALAIAAVIYLARDLVILIVFTEKFGRMRELFAYQLLGDVLMVACWPLRMGLVARVRVRQYMAVEFMTAAVFVAGTYVLLPLVGLKGAPIAYLSSFAISLMCLVVLHARVRHES